MKLNDDQDEDSFMDSARFIDDKSLIVDGYLKDCQKLFKSKSIYYTIPQLIYNIILMYIVSFKWDTLNKGWNIAITDNGKSIEQIISKSTKSNTSDNNKSNEEHFGSLFSQNIMSRNVYHWRFKIKEITNIETTFGIIGVKDEMICDDKFYGEKTKTAYGMIINYGRLTDTKSKYGTKCKANDIVEMVVDMKEYELKFIINNVDYGVAFRLKRGKYKLAITMEGNASFSLQTYHMTL